MSPEAECAMTFLYHSPVGDRRAVTTKVLREIMLDTNGDLTHVFNGFLTPTEIRKKSLGAGVYRIWLEKVEKKK